MYCAQQNTKRFPSNFLGMKKILLIMACMLLTACVENLVHLNILPTGKYSIRYNSTGDKVDLENLDFSHPESTNQIKWFSSMKYVGRKNDISKNLDWEKETIATTALDKRLMFSNSESLSYEIDVNTKKYFFWDKFYFDSTIHSLNIDKKYPSIVEFLNIEADSLSWIVPAKEYVITASLKDYDQKIALNDIFKERINSQVDSYFSYAKERDLIKKFDNNSLIILKDVLKPISETLPKNFFNEMEVFINKHENDLEKNTELMNDYFQFNVRFPGKIQEHNGKKNKENILIWSFDFDDIAQDEFKMYANSIRLNILRIQIVFGLIMMSLLGMLWKQRIKRK